MRKYVLVLLAILPLGLMAQLNPEPLAIYPLAFRDITVVVNDETKTTPPPATNSQPANQGINIGMPGSGISIGSNGININVIGSQTPPPAEVVSGSDLCNQVQGVLEEVFRKTGKFTILSRQGDLSAVREEQRFQDVSTDVSVDFGKTKGAKYVVQTMINSAGVTKIIKAPDPSTNTPSQTFYVSNITVTVKLIEVETGVMVFSQSFSQGTKIFQPGAATSATGSLTKQTDRLKKDIGAFLEKQFPSTCMMVAIDQRDKKGNALIVGVLCGAAYGLKKGDNIDLVKEQVVEANGRKVVRRIVIGKGKVDQLQGQESAGVRVISGGDAISAAFAADPKSLSATVVR
jgi:hypothetical protein